LIDTNWKWRFLVLLLLFLPGRARGAGGIEDWKFEVLYLKSGGSLKGLVEQETEKTIKFTHVKRDVKGKASCWVHTFSRGEVAGIERLKGKDRELLVARVKALDPKFTNDRAGWKTLTLQPAPWGMDKTGGLSYASKDKFFVLVSNAREDIVGRASFRLNSIYSAYQQFLPPRMHNTKPTKIILVKSVAEYRSLAKSRGRNIRNPAFYDLKRNEIVCGAELQRLDDALEEVRKQEAQWKKQTAAVKKRYKGKIPAVIRAQLKRDQDEIDRVKGANDKAFEVASKWLFQTLYHEAFHAYLETFVYSDKAAHVPSWLNEGMAQIFEIVQVEAGDLHIGRIDKLRLLRVKALVNDGKLISLEKLLRAKPTQFHMIQGSDHQPADGYYLASWALAYYLWQEQKVLRDPKKIEGYLSSLKAGTEAMTAFRQLVGKPLPQFEKDFHEYLRCLKENGSLFKKASR
jgi:hypothetical protein